jgi:hypothetical protein
VLKSKIDGRSLGVRWSDGHVRRRVWHRLSKAPGGIGGLLAVSLPGGSGFTTASDFYDGNGNVTSLASDAGTLVARYRYSPFGERLEATGPLAEANPYQFSSKPRDEFGGL